MRRSDVTGLVLAGGRGSRMGGLDKGLQPAPDGVPLARRALERLAPQVGPLLVSANRHLDRYATFGAEVVCDAVAGHPGPLAGLLAGLAACRTPWLACVPCDSPRFPTDLVARLGGGLGAAKAAVAATHEDGAPRRQPVFCLLHRDLRPALEDYLAGGGRAVEGWLAAQGAADVVFDDAAAFFNANTLEDLQQL